MTAINELKVFDINVYPNPISDIITIDLVDPLNVVIMDLFGKPLLESNLTSDNNQIDLSNFPTGTYLMKLKDKNSNITIRKIVRIK